MPVTIQHLTIIFLHTIRRIDILTFWFLLSFQKERQLNQRTINRVGIDIIQPVLVNKRFIIYCFKEYIIYFTVKRIKEIIKIITIEVYSRYFCIIFLLLLIFIVYEYVPLVILKRFCRRIKCSYETCITWLINFKNSKQYSIVEINCNL